MLSDGADDIERISFTPGVISLTLGQAKRFTLTGKPDAILRPQRLRSNSPCRGFVSITRIKFGDQIHFEAPEGYADSADLEEISETIMFRGGFHTLSNAYGAEIECAYSGLCTDNGLYPISLVRGETFSWMLSIQGPGILKKKGVAND